MLLVACGADLKKTFLAQGEFNPSLPRPSTPGPPPPYVVESSLRPAQFPLRKPSQHRSVAGGGACIGARTSRLIIDAPPLLPKNTHDSSVNMPNEPRMAELYHPAQALQPNAAA